MSYGRMLKEEKRLTEEIQELLEKAEAIDEQEDNRYGPDRRGDELPEELARRESRLQRIQEAKKALEAKAKVAAQQAQEQREQEDSKDNNRPKRGRKRKAISGMVQNRVTLFRTRRITIFSVTSALIDC